MRTGWVWVVVIAGCGQIEAPTEQVAPRRDRGHDPHPRHRPQPPREPRACKHANEGHGHGHSHAPTCALVGTAGGSVAVPNGPTLTIPPGALGADTEISVAVSTQAAPTGALTPRYTFSPAGLAFAQPVAIDLPLPTGTTNASLYWSRASGAGFDRLGGTIAGGALHARVVHFSDGYAAPSGGPLHVVLSLVYTHFVDAVQTDYSYPPLTDYDPHFYATAGTGLVRVTPDPSPTNDGPGLHGYDLPAGTIGYQVRVTDRVYGPLSYAATGDVDIGMDWQGRSNATPVTAPTAVRVQVGGLAAWDSSQDQLYAQSAEAPMIWALPANDGDLSVDDIVQAPDDQDNNFLVQASQGDHLDVVQLTPVTGGPVPYTAQTRVLRAAIEQHQGDTTLVTGDLDAGIAHTVAVDFPASQFNTPLGYDAMSGVFTKLGPTAFATSNDVTVEDVTCPGGCLTYQTPATTDSAVSGLAFATTGALAGPSVFYEVGCFAQYQLAGTTSAAGVLCTADGGGAPGTVFVPDAAPISDAHFQTTDDAAQSAVDPSHVVTGVGPRPTVTWTGNGDHYYAVLWEIIGTPGGPTTKHLVQQFTTDVPSLELPDDLVLAGHTYALRITTEHHINLQRLEVDATWSRVRWMSTLFTP